VGLLPIIDLKFDVYNLCSIAALHAWMQYSSDFQLMNCSSALLAVIHMLPAGLLQ